LHLKKEEEEEEVAKDKNNMGKKISKEVAL
jgi:hypothetical protein